MKVQNSNGHSCCSPKNQSAESSSDFAKDPVCGMQVDKKNSKWHSDYQQTQYYFCNTKCQEKFQAEPERFLSRKNSEAQQQEGIEHV